MIIPALADIQRERERRRLTASQLAFTCAMFESVHNMKFSIGAPQELICAALDRVMSGDIKRLIINIPPGYSKSEIAVINFMARGIAADPSCRFIHATYSQTLALDNSSKVRDVINCEAFKELWNVEMRADTSAKGLWRTTKGGGVRAASSGEPITGFRAGHIIEDGKPWKFTGCFTYETNVWTENGLMPIGDIVSERKSINVWAYDYNGNMVLRPVIGWHENPPNDIVRVTFDDGSTVECTPDHKIYTHNRGWVRADSLSEDDCLPIVNRGVEALNNVCVNTKPFGCRGYSETVLSSGSVVPISYGELSVLSGKDGSVCGINSTFGGNVLSTCDGLPRVTAPYLVNYSLCNPVSLGNGFRTFPCCVVDGKCVSISDGCARVNPCLTKGSVGFAVGDVGGPSVISEVGHMVVEWVPISVADVMPIWPFSYECLCNEAVHTPYANASFLRQANTLIAMAIEVVCKDSTNYGVALPSPGFNIPSFATNRTSVANGVAPFISGYRKPISIDYIGHRTSTFCMTVKGYHNFTVEQGVIVKNCLIIDDPLKPDDAHSDTTRKFINARWHNTFKSRLASEDVPVIVIMQRLHTDDFVASLLETSGEKWHVLKLPILVDGECDPIHENAIMIPHNLPNGPLWDKKHTLEQIEVLKLSPHVFAGQYMQEPVTEGGNLFKVENLQEYDELPPLQWRALYVDTAQKTGERNDYSVIQHWGRTRDGRAYLIDQMRAKFEAPELEAAALAMWMKARAYDIGKYGSLRKMAIEDKVSGTGLIQSLKRKAIPIVAIQRNKDKYTRALDVVPYVAAGLVNVPRNAVWLKDYVSEMAAFPEGAHDDIVDPTMDALIEMCGVGLYTLDNL